MFITKKLKKIAVYFLQKNEKYKIKIKSFYIYIYTMNKLSIEIFSQLFMNVFEGIEIDIIGGTDYPWFLAADVSKILKIDYKCAVPENHIRNFFDKTYIDSTGLYHMLMKSNEKECVSFQETVFEGCFPHISELVLNSKREINIRPLPKPKLKKVYKRKIIRKKNKSNVNLSFLLEKLTL